MKAFWVALIFLMSNGAYAQYNSQYSHAIPPHRFDHPYKGKLSLIYVDTGTVYKICRRPANACAIRNRGKCLVVIDQISRGRESTLRHEIAHCNGWSANHEP